LAWLLVRRAADRYASKAFPSGTLFGGTERSGVTIPSESLNAIISVTMRSKAPHALQHRNQARLPFDGEALFDFITIILPIIRRISS